LPARAFRISAVFVNAGGLDRPTTPIGYLPLAQPPPVPWAYGIKANRTTIHAFLRYHWEQGLSSRGLRVEEPFLDSLISP
jgi:hypothetical protein